MVAVVNTLSLLLFFLDYGYNLMLKHIRIHGRLMRESRKDSKGRKELLFILEPILKDLGLARRRLRKWGTARWLFDFAYSDLDTLSAGEIMNFGFDSLALVIPKDPKSMDNQELEYAAFTALLFTTPRKDLSMLPSEELDKISPESILKELSAPLELLRKPSRGGPTEWLFGFHDELRKRFDGFFTGHYWTHIEPPTERFLLCPGVPPYDNILKLDSSDLPPNIHLQLVEHLMLIAGRAVFAEKEKFGVCERCKKPFIAEKNPLRKFCSSTCAQYVRTTRYRQKQRGS
jgi:hypothetical protein